MTDPTGQSARRLAREVTQTIFYDPVLNDLGILGNCFQAATASLLDLPLEAVPHFLTFNDYRGAAALWGSGRGIDVYSAECDAIPPGRCLVVGMSPRGVSHVCVAVDGEIVWDPHPSRGGLDTITAAWFFVPLARVTEVGRPATAEEQALWEQMTDAAREEARRG